MTLTMVIIMKRRTLTKKKRTMMKMDWILKRINILYSCI